MTLSSKPQLTISTNLNEDYNDTTDSHSEQHLQHKHNRNCCEQLVGTVQKHKNQLHLLLLAVVITVLSLQISSLRTDVEVVQRENELLRAQIVSSSSKLGELNTQISLTGAEVASLESQVDVSKSNLAFLNQNYQDLLMISQQIPSLNNSINTVNALITSNFSAIRYAIGPGNAACVATFFASSTELVMGTALMESSCKDKIKQKKINNEVTLQSVRDNQDLED
jgi:chromosome segregation ATPase